MAYQKGSFDSFKQKLNGGEYDSATGARRAIGKLAGLDDAEKDKARKLVDAHFGESGGKTKPATKAPKKEKAAAAPKKAAAAATTRQPRAPKAAATSAKEARAPRHTAPSGNGSTLEQLAIGERVVNSAVAALNTLQGIANTIPDAQVHQTIGQFTGTMDSAARIFRKIVTDTVGPDEPEQVRRSSVQAAGEPSVEPPVANGVDSSENEGSGGRVLFPELQAH